MSVCVCVCVYRCVYVGVCRCEWVHMCCGWVRVGVSECVCVRVSVCVCECLCSYGWVCWVTVGCPCRPTVCILLTTYTLHTRPQRLHTCNVKLMYLHELHIKHVNSHLPSWMMFLLFPNVFANVLANVFAIEFLVHTVPT